MAKKKYIQPIIEDAIGNMSSGIESMTESMEKLENKISTSVEILNQILSITGMPQTVISLSVGTMFTNPHHFKLFHTKLDDFAWFGAPNKTTEAEEEMFFEPNFHYFYLNLNNAYYGFHVDLSEHKKIKFAMYNDGGEESQLTVQINDNTVWNNITSSADPVESPEIDVTEYTGDCIIAFKTSTAGSTTIINPLIDDEYYIPEKWHTVSSFEEGDASIQLNPGECVTLAALDYTTIEVIVEIISYRWLGTNTDKLTWLLQDSAGNVVRTGEGEVLSCAGLTQKYDYAIRLMNDSEEVITITETQCRVTYTGI